MAAINKVSSRSVTQKLQLKDGMKFLLVNPPVGYKESLGKLPRGVSLLSELSGQAEVIQVFVSSRVELEKQLVKLKPLLSPQGILWVTYPKDTSKIRTEINRDSIRKHAQSIDLEAVAIFSVDANWAALRLKIS